jgi:hypothetical protein
MFSTDGDASATHRSCSGFVNTPILAFEGFSIAALGISVAEGAMVASVLISLSCPQGELTTHAQRVAVVYRVN